MTPKQLFERLKTNIRAMTWGDTENKIFGDGCWIVPQIPIQQAAQWPQIACFIVDEGYVCDPEHPILVTQNFSITIFAENLQSALGEAAMIGACRTADTSTGAGVLDVEYEFLRKFTEIIALASAKIMLLEKSSPKPQQLSGNYPLLLRGFSCSALCSVR